MIEPKDRRMDEIWSLGLWVKQRRRALDITQDRLAMLVGCSVETIRKIEGDARRPSRQIALLLAQHLDLPPQEQQRFVRVARGLLGPAHLPALREHAASTTLPASARLTDNSRPSPAAKPEASGAALPASQTERAEPDTNHTNLPAPPTPLIGRAKELAARG